MTPKGKEEKKGSRERMKEKEKASVESNIFVPHETSFGSKKLKKKTGLTILNIFVEGSWTKPGPGQACLRSNAQQSV